MPPPNKFLLGTVVVLAVIVAFLSGIIISKPKQTSTSPTVKSDSIEIKTIPTSSPTPIPKTKTKIIPKPATSTPIPTPTRKRKLVPITIKMTGQTYYCYEDKVNELANLDLQVSLSMNVYEGCKEAANLTKNACLGTCQGDDYDTCLNACYDKYNSDVNNCINQVPGYGNELMQKISQYCP